MYQGSNGHGLAVYSGCSDSAGRVQRSHTNCSRRFPLTERLEKTSELAIVYKPETALSKLQTKHAQTSQVRIPF